MERILRLTMKLSYWHGRDQRLAITSQANPSIKRAFFHPVMRFRVKQVFPDLAAIIVLLTCFAFVTGVTGAIGASDLDQPGTGQPSLNNVSKVKTDPTAPATNSLKHLSDYTRKFRSLLSDHLVVKVSKPAPWCTHLQVVANQEGVDNDTDIGDSSTGCRVAMLTHRRIDANTEALDITESVITTPLEPTFKPISELPQVASEPEKRLAKSDSHDFVQVHRPKTIALTTINPVPERNSETEHNDDDRAPLAELTDSLESTAFVTQLNANAFSFDLFTLDGSTIESSDLKSKKTTELAFASAQRSTVTSAVTLSENTEKLETLTADYNGFIELGRSEPFVIMLDPGHGGGDTGTIGPAGTQEKHLTRDVARRVRILAELHNDIEIILSSDNDKGMSRAERVTSITSASPDALLSLHFNSLPQKDVVLVETYYATEADLAASVALQNREHSNSTLAIDSDVNSSTKQATTRKPLTRSGQPAVKSIIGREQKSQELATIVQSQVFAKVQNKNPHAIDAGVKSDAFYVLTQTGIPGILVELSCLSNAEEEKRLGTEVYRTDLAHALMDAIRTYVDKQKNLSTQASDNINPSSSA